MFITMYNMIDIYGCTLQVYKCEYPFSIRKGRESAAYVAYMIMASFRSRIPSLLHYLDSLLKLPRTVLGAPTQHGVINRACIEIYLWIQ